MELQVGHIVVRGSKVSVRVRHGIGTGRVVVLALRRGRKLVERRFSGNPSRRQVTFEAKLGPGRWVIVVSGKPAKGFAVPRAHRLAVKIR